MRLGKAMRAEITRQLTDFAVAAIPSAVSEWAAHRDRSQKLLRLSGRKYGRRRHSFFPFPLQRPRPVVINVMRG
jgi:hypothetical protein